MKNHFPLILFHSVVIALLWIIITITPTQADGVGNAGNWIDITWYCGGGRGGICVPITANHRSDVHVEYYRVDLYRRVVYWVQFGGFVYPKTSLCGYHDWSKGNTAFVTSLGSIAIGGWFATGVWCRSDSVCRNYRSHTAYWLACTTCRGHFQSNTWFTNRCFPNLGPSRVLSVTF